MMYHVIDVEMGAPFIPRVEVSENCLTLDVYTSSLNGSRPVMVYIHGGGLTGGEHGLQRHSAFVTILPRITVELPQFARLV